MKLALSVAATVAIALSEQSQAKSPNFVILFADDLGYGDIGANGAPSWRTPNLDRLAFEGIRFGSWYSAAPVCTPSRAGLYTGRFPVRSGTAGPYIANVSDYEKSAGVFSCNADYGLPLNETTFAEHLKSVGYQTMLAGKWHEGQRQMYLPNKRGFDRYAGIPYSVDMGGSYFQGKYYGSSECSPLPLFNMSGPDDYTIFQQPAVFDTLAQFYANETTRFIRQHAKGPDPFLLVMAHSHVHTAVPGDAEFAGKQFWNSTGRGPFGDAASEMDWVAGQILDELDAQGIAEDTVVFFTSDNGPWRIKGLDGGTSGVYQGLYAILNYGYADTGKASTWQGGITMPAAVRWTGKTPANAVNYNIHSTMDIFPTMLTLAGVQLPHDRVIDGKDMSGLLQGQDDTPHETLMHYREGTIFAARKGGFKAHFATKSGYGNDKTVVHDPPLFFNTLIDPMEQYPIDVKHLPSGIYEDIMAAVAAHRETLANGTTQNLLGPSNSSYAVCCDASKQCMCTGPDGTPFQSQEDARRLWEEGQHRALGSVGSAVHAELWPDLVNAGYDKTGVATAEEIATRPDLRDW